MSVRVFGLHLPINSQAMLPALCLTALLLALFYLLPASFTSLHYTREAVIEGQWWRLVSAQWVHHDGPHLWLNIGGLWLWWLLFIERLPSWRHWLLLLPIMLASTAAHMMSPQGAMSYAGFSGCLYGMFAYASARDITLGRHSSWLILLAIIGKNGYDLWVLPATTDIAIYSHLGGMAMALLLATWITASERLTRLTRGAN
jgi:rhomboid family GlyGly-CTERM serine protease